MKIKLGSEFFITCIFCTAVIRCIFLNKCKPMCKQNLMCIYSLVFIFNCFLSFSQSITAPFIKSVTLQAREQKGDHCFFRLGQTITISFDDLQNGFENYQYHLQHCDSNWQPTDINFSQYLEGFDNGFINDYENANGTLQNYTHYTFSLPNTQTKITATGNYILTIYKGFKEKCIQRRLVIYENKVQILGKVIRSNFDIEQKQMLAFSVYYKGISINNPNSEITVKIIQNNDWNTCKTLTSSLFFDHQKITYRDDKQTTFWGGNEFYYFDSKNLNSTNMQIAKSQIERQGLYHTYLYPKKIQQHIFYKFNPDIDGNFIIRSLNGFNSKIQSDYTWVHFYLQDENINSKDKIYVYGAFNNYAIGKKNKMLYDEQQQLWVAKILLKQGFYNYKFIKTNDKKIATCGLSGSFFQTQNTYTVVVYYRPFGAFLQKIIGLQQIYSF